MVLVNKCRVIPGVCVEGVNTRWCKRWDKVPFPWKQTSGWFLLGNNMHSALQPSVVWLGIVPGNPMLLVASIQKSFGSSRRDWKLVNNLPIPCKFCTYRFIRYPPTRYRKYGFYRSWQLWQILTFLLPRWWMSSGLLWFGHVDWMGLC